MSKFLWKKRNKVISFFIFVAIFVIFYIINKRTPLWSDDWAFYVSYGSKRVTSLGDVLASIKSFYLDVNGRSISNLVTMLFVFFGKNVFNFFNALVFVFFGWEIYFFASDGKKMKPLMLVAIFMLLWFLLPAPNQTLFWQAGSAYLWMATLCLLFLMPFYGLIVKKNVFVKNNVKSIAGMFLLGILAGNSHELIAPIVILSVSLIIFIFWKEKWVLPKWCYSGLTGALIGFLLQLVAPGNHKKNVQGGGAFDFLGGFNQVLKKVVDNQLILWEIAGVIIIAYFINRIFFKSEKKIADPLMFFLLVMALLLNIMGVVYPYFPPRALFFSSVALIIFFSRFLLLDELVKAKYLTIIVLVPLYVFSIKTAIGDSGDLHVQYQKREASILAQKLAGSRNIVVDRVKKTKNPMLLNDPLLPHQDHNFWASRFYGVDTIDLN